MRVGIVMPVLVRVPGAHGRWEREASVADVVAIAGAADRLGFDYLTCSEHVAVPVAMADSRGTTYWDPLATLSYLAAVTEHIRLVPSVLVLGYHHPLAIAKRYGTLDVLSGGRLVLGVGVGSLAEEFALLGAPFDDRGARADDSLRALRASLGQARPEYHGAYLDFSGMVVDPCATRTDVPIWVGGRTRRSLRRAVALADGWMPFGLDGAALASMLAGTDLPPGFTCALTPERALDPIGAPAATADALGAMATIGATVVNARVVGRSPAHFIEQLEALAPMAGP